MPGYSMKRYEVVRAQSSENIKDWGTPNKPPHPWELLIFW
jgi:hypothetical protein